VQTAKVFIFIGAVVAGLLCERPLARAQPASGPTSSESSPAPPVGEPTPADDDSSSEDESILVDDPSSPWSQGVSAEDRRAARALLREGTRLYLIPLYAKAAEQYAEALRKWKHPGIYYNLALAQRNLDKESDALESLQHALQYGEKGLGPTRFRQAQKQLADVKRMLGRLRVTCHVPGAEVTLDGVTLFIGPGSYEGWVKAKSHELTAKKEGYLSEATRVVVTPEARQVIELKLVTLSQATDAGRRWATWKPWAVVAIGGAIATAGGVIHALASRNFNDHDKTFLGLPCVTEPDPVSPGCTKEQVPSELNDQLTLARRQQMVAVGSYIAGGTLIATGVVLLYLNRLRLAEQKGPTQSHRDVAVVPAISGDSYSILFSVTR